ncbi:MAG: DUF3822 family protein [Bacteroidetes bacterium]|nr:DUF3822 family protein [Bacteroidota bacterium]
MVTQTLSISTPFDQIVTSHNNKLIIEISNYHIALIVKNDKNIEAFELYDVDTTKSNWQNIFAAIKNYSKILAKQYAQSIVYLNIADALIVPASKFSKESIEPYLTTVFGNSTSYKCESETIQIPENPITIYRLPLTLDTAVESNFKLTQYRHTYTKILENLLGSSSTIIEIIKVQFYAKHMIVTVVNNSTLQLIQSYAYNSAEDVIYYLLNIVQEFGLNVKSTPVEVSGLIDTQGKHFELLENVFGRLSLETLTVQSIFKEHLTVANAHYYTPFYNLSL